MKSFYLLTALMLIVSDFQIDGSACMMTPKDFRGRISQNSHKAILIHRNGQQDMILKIGYQFAGKTVPDKFAWIVTVPNEPEKYNVATDSLFSQVDRWAHSMVMKKVKRASRGSADTEVDSLLKSEPLIFGKPAKVGPYDIQPVQARGLAALTALNKWLTDNGFPTEDPEHMKYFVKNRFTFLAIKISPEKGNQLSKSGILPPLHLSFESKAMYYPLMFSSRQGIFDLQLFTLTDKKLNYRRSAEALKKIRWEDSDFERNVSVKVANLPAELTKTLKKSAFQERIDRYYLNVLNCHRVNTGNAIANWKSDVFLTIDESDTAKAGFPYYFPFGIAAAFAAFALLWVMPKNRSSKTTKLKAASVCTLLIAAGLITLSSCSTSSAISHLANKQVEPGPVKLRNLEHLQSYLFGHDRGGDSWRKSSRVKSETTAEVIWNFQSKGQFHVWLEKHDSKQSPPENFFSDTTGLEVDAETTAVRGKYKVTMKEIQLTEVRTASGKTLKDQNVPIKWIDGKLRIGINGQQLMRVIPKSATPPDHILNRFK